MEQGARVRADVLIVTAIPVEYDAVLQVEEGAVPDSAWHEAKQANGVAMASRSFARRSGPPLHVAVAVAPDMASAATLATLLPLIETLQPRCIAMCGVCAGKPGAVQLGDVVVAERLYNHDTGKELRKPREAAQVQQDLRTFNLRPDWKVALERLADKGVAERFRGRAWFEARPLTSEWRERRALLALARGSAAPWAEVDAALDDREWRELVAGLRARAWVEGSSLTEAGRKAAEDLRFEVPATPDLSPHGSLHPFRMHVAAMATGARVIEDEKVWARLAKVERKTLALDMEAAALGAVAHYLHHRRLDTLVVKGVMDFANHGRTPQFKKWAARASAECLLWFLREHAELSAGESGATRTSPRPGAAERAGKIFRKLIVGVALGILGLGTWWAALAHTQPPPVVPPGPLPDMVRISAGALPAALGPAERARLPAACLAAAATEECSGPSSAGARVATFDLDRTEVTNRQFATWLNTYPERWQLASNGEILTKQAPPVSLALIDPRCGEGLVLDANRRPRPGADKGDLPVVCVTWHGANEHCRAYGKRLPLTTEWDLAARGPQGRLFPWGDELPRPDLVAFELHNGSTGDPRPVGASAQDATPVGVHDLGANVAEWVEDHRSDLLRKPLRGGTWASVGPCHLLGTRCRRMPTDATQADLGFRCARSVLRSQENRS